jgi:hypothetical protein
MIERRISIRLIAGAVALVVLAGCTTFSRDGGFNTVSTTASERLGKEALFVRTEQDRDAVAQRTRELLGKPLAMDDAVQVALLNNAGLQASYAELGISEADLVQAGRLPIRASVSAARTGATTSASRARFPRTCWPS